jgi:hypothetical protein
MKFAIRPWLPEWVARIIRYTLHRAPLTNIAMTYTPPISGLPGNNLKISVIIERDYV